MHHQTIAGNSDSMIHSTYHPIRSPSSGQSTGKSLPDSMKCPAQDRPQIGNRFLSLTRPIGSCEVRRNPVDAHRTASKDLSLRYPALKISSQITNVQPRCSSPTNPFLTHGKTTTTITPKAAQANQALRLHLDDRECRT